MIVDFLESGQSSFLPFGIQIERLQEIQIVVARVHDQTR